MRAPLLIAATGLAAGLLVGFVLPASWVFVDGDRAHAGHEVEGEKYACPMFCVVMERKPAGGKCPVCGMELTVISGRQTLNSAERRMVGLEVLLFDRDGALEQRARLLEQAQGLERQRSRRSSPGPPTRCSSFTRAPSFAWGARSGPSDGAGPMSRSPSFSTSARPTAGPVPFAAPIRFFSQTC